VLLFFFFRALWKRRREKKFIDRILEHGKNQEDLEEEKLSGELVKRWREAVTLLKKSHLKHQGNPLYVLPWYMLIGESGSGKSTAIRNSKLNSSFTSQARISGVAGTKNCDWWFFEEAVVIDTAGRYSIQPDEKKDRDEWKIFLDQLARYRKREPLNGLVVTVAADSLLSTPSTDLEDEGLKIRMRTEELMQTLDARFPVYLLVTKCDLVRGMAEFCESLPPAAHDQGFGCLNLEPGNDTASFVDRAFSTLADRLRYFRLHVANRPGFEKISPEAFLFPEEFGRLRQGVETFVKGAFSKNIYKEAPLLRGIYFASGRQTGVPLSGFGKTHDLRLDDAGKNPSDKSYFLRDFFRSILPSDRGMFAPTQTLLTYKKKTRVMGYAGWVLAATVLCGLLSYSFAHSLATLRQVQREIPGPPEVTGVLVRDVNSFDSACQAIVRVEERNRARWLPWFGLDQCVRVEKALKADFCKRFSGHLLGPYDQKMEDESLYFTDNTPSQIVGRTVGHYSRRINLIENAQNGSSLADLEKLQQPDFEYLMAKPGEPAIPKSFTMIQNQYRYCLVWSDQDSLVLEKKRMRGSLIKMAAKDDLSLRWMIDWCNENAGGKTITLSDFWPGTKVLAKEEHISQAYTRAGSEMIHGILDEIETSLDDKGAIQRKKLDFLKEYRESYIATWYRFALNFPSGEYKLNHGKEEMLAAQKMAGNDGPYFAFLERMGKELGPCINEKDETPAWIGLVMDYTATKTYVESEGKLDQAQGLVKTSNKGVKLLGVVGKAVAGSAPPAESLMVSGEALKKYKLGLDSLSKACVSLPSSLKLAADVFSEDPTLGESPLAVSRRTADELKSSLPKYMAGQKMFAQLIDGPVDFLWSLSVRRAGCQLQKLWVETVLSEVQGVSDRKAMSDMLIGKDGYVQSFAKGPAAPFVNRDMRRGYYPKSVAGKTIPFRSEFFFYLTRSSVASKAEQTMQSSYKVRLEGLPTDSNPDATLSPHATKLEMNCKSGGQSLDNYNYPVSRTFEWSPTECGDVNLRIVIGDLVLTREYTGNRSFQRFLRDFGDGQHTFYRTDFPDQDTDLKRLGIKFIKVKYRISGGGAVTSLQNTESSAVRVPEVIVSCSG
jgi:type VI secretion system protein ImpL